MSGKSLNKKLNKAFGKIANAAGFEFKAYRSVDNLAPVQAKNYIGTTKMAYAIDDTFNKSVGYGFSVFNLFMDGSNFQPGDIFVCEEISRRFTLVCNDQMVKPQGVESSGSITINRPAFSTTGAFQATTAEVARDIPATILGVGASTDPVSNAGQSPAKSGIQQWNMWTYLPKDWIKLNDIIVDSNGNRSKVLAIEYSELGYKLKTESVAPGK